MTYGHLVRNHVAPFVEFEFGDRLTGSDRFVNDEFLDRILGVEITHTDFGSKEITVRLDNHDLKFFEEATLIAQNIDMGQKWTVRWGYGTGAMSPMHVFGVSSVKGTIRELEVTAIDDSYTLQTPAKKRTFPGPILRSDVVKKIAEEHGFIAEVPDVFPTFKEFPSIAQSGMSDGEFITQLADKVGYVWYVEDWFPGEQSRMHFKPRLFGARSRGTLVVGEDQRILSDPVFETDLTKIPESAVGQMYDPYRKAIRTFKAKNSITDRPVLGKATPNAPGIGGNPPDGGDDEARAAVHSGAVDAKDLAELIDGFWKIRDQNLVRVTMLLQGMTTFRPDTVLTLAGIGRGLNGDYYVSEVRHSIGSDGWVMEAKLLRNALSHIDIYALRHQVMEEIGGQQADHRTGFRFSSSEDDSPVRERPVQLGFHDEPTAEDIRRRFR